MKLYNRLVCKATSINLQNLLHIRLENWLTPKKFNEIRNFKAIKANVATIDWIKKLSAMFDMAGKREIEAFDRIRLSKNICLYTDKSSKLKKKNNLVLCFTGAAQRMMMPLPVFLQHFDAKSTDIVLIKYPKGNGYFNGISGIANDFDGSLDIIYSLIDCKSYVLRVSFGCSAGALPALLAGLKFSFDAIMSVGTGSPYNERWAKEGDETFASNYIKRHSYGDSPPIYLVYGKDDIDDKRSASDIVSLIKATKIVISASRKQTGHVCLPAIVNARKFKSFLEETLFKVQGVKEVSK